MWLLLISLPVYHLIHPSLSVSFPPCESIPSAYCCTPRVRSQCPQLCASISSCAAPYTFLFNRDPSALHSHSHPQEGVASASAASAAVSIAEERGQVFPTLLPPPAIDTDIAAIDSIPALSIVRGVEAPRKNGDGLGLVDGSTGDAKKKEGNAESQIEKGVIVPPASLTLISQGGDEEKEEAEAAEHFFTDELPPKDRGERRMIKVDKGTLEEQSELLDLVDHLIESARENSAMRNRSRKHLEEKNEPEEKEQIPIPTRTTTTIGPWVTRTWKINFHNGSSSSTQSASSAVTTPTVSSKTSPSPLTTSIPPTSFISPPLPASVCGKAPDFSSCVPMEKADAAFHSCCQNAALPAGCLGLCKYSTTHKEVKSAIDRGLCSVVAVPTFLKCASQGHDNSECCRHRAVHVKTGLQCEEFCRGSASPLLGLQHLICTSVVSDFLHCHLSGLRD